MLEWIDRDTFKIDSELCTYNYNNLVSIGVYAFKDEFRTKLVMKMCTGDKIVLYECPTNDEFKVKKLKEHFTKFYQSRPGNNEPNKIKIK